ncbi:MFS transporter [Bradyrhizobium prioriisuperbiae]|uniref:MFS transporter n=1 Tax=Bradyrhizobium prioriisuperbiae TaxID=2854389 RepID=UPI0028EBC091|nr:MFS transporter [Bradyrhizobium prioritasuperba]
MTDDPHKTAKTWVLALTSIASFMVALDALTLTTALTTIRADLQTSIDTLEWTFNAYNITFAVLLLTGAALGDRFGRRRIFAAGLGLFVAASVGCALARDIGALIAARAIQGMGAALVMPLAMALLSATFTREERARVLGLFSGITGLALIVGPVVGGAIAGGLAWQWIFWINLPIGCVVILLLLRHCPESFGPPAALDMPGLALVTGATLAIVWALVRGNHVGWASTEVATALIVGLIAAATFVGWELRTPAPMVPMRLFRNIGFSSAIGASFLFYASMYSVVFFLPQFLQTAQSYGPLDAGLRLLPWTATLFVFAPIGGRLVNRLGERLLVAGGTLLQAIGFAWIALIATPGLAFVHLLAPLILAGAGISLAMPAAQNAVLGAVALTEIGKASGIFNMSRFLGGAFGVALLVAVFATRGSIASPQAFNSGFAVAIGVSAALSFAAAIVALALPSRRALAIVPAKASA